MVPYVSEENRYFTLKDIHTFNQNSSFNSKYIDTFNQNWSFDP